MVYQDYELVPTKRVNKSRHGQRIMLTHQWNALGAWPTVFLGAFFGYSASTFTNLFHGVPLVTPITSKAGVKSLLRNAGVLAAPSALGVFIGIMAFGDVRQFVHLLRNNFTYRREFKQIHSELYYN